MPRSARKESGYGIYHVMMRGINRQAIFDDDEDCRRFMDILADLPFQHDEDGNLLPIRTCAVYAWCLMSNHFHLLVQAMGLEERMTPVLEHVLKNHKVTNSDVQHLLVVSKPTATRLLQKLDVLLEQVGHGAGAYYKIRNY